MTDKPEQLPAEPDEPPDETEGGGGKPRPGLGDRPEQLPADKPGVGQPKPGTGPGGSGKPGGPKPTNPIVEPGRPQPKK